MFQSTISKVENGTQTGTAASLAAVGLDGNRANVPFQPIIYNIILTEREHCIKVFMGNLLKDDNFF